MKKLLVKRFPLVQSNWWCNKGTIALLDEEVNKTYLRFLEQKEHCYIREKMQH